MGRRNSKFDDTNWTTYTTNNCLAYNIVNAISNSQRVYLPLTAK